MVALATRSLVSAKRPKAGQEWLEAGNLADRCQEDEVKREAKATTKGESLGRACRKAWDDIAIECNQGYS